uniref:Uncharacterized protein n=1 Tax=Globisporangium ultimum (strain ATCC 200006 / CBS 805.95 / DAOM BR144) TaxID=431595 RepID=K3WAL2_GLOUD
MEVLTSEKNQDDNGPNSEVALTEPQADQSERTDWLLPSSVLEELESLTSLKRSILEQLTILEERIEEFHSAIVDSPSLTVNELCREILLMEYRVGSLQIENMELQMARKFKNTEIDDSWGAINPQAKNGSDDTDGMLAKKHLEPLKMPLLNQASPKFSAIQPPKLATTTEEGSPSLENVSQRGSPRNTLGFMEDLRDRLYSRKSRHGDTASRQPSMNEIPSARKQWGIHLTSTALPYIRLKKKSPPSDVSSSPSNAQAVAMSAPKWNASTTAPYLRVLKHRRKSHQSAKKAAVPNMSSQKKGKLEHLPAT